MNAIIAPREPNMVLRYLQPLEFADAEIGVYNLPISFRDYSIDPKTYHLTDSSTI